jgi:hypothetical protein
VIYTQASLVEWHHFWFAHLVPALKETHDAEGLTAHVYRVGQWKNEDAAGVLAFWAEALEIDWLDHARIAEQLSSSLSDFTIENLPLVAPLLERLINMPIPEDSFLGHTVARCIAAGAVDDRLLWRYIAGDISEDDVIEFDLGNKLRFQPHEFRDKDDNFLDQRMMQSTVLLDLGLEAVEQWSQIEASRYGATRAGYREGFLRNTSYRYVHSQVDIQPVDCENFLFDAIEGAILHHAQRHSAWWQDNRERLSFSYEGALRYFAILAFTNSPQPNIDLISRLLCDRNLLESELCYELGTLIQAAFVYLDDQVQNAVMVTIQAIWEEAATDEDARSWILNRRAEYVSVIPCYLRSPETQAILDDYERKNGTLIRQPSIGVYGGVVAAPFSFEVFLSASDNGVIRLLNHYSGYERDRDDFLVGGERQVGRQMREATSRHPSRFLRFLVTHWSILPSSFRDDILEGTADYLAYRHGNLRPNSTWVPIEESDTSDLVDQVLEELERHPAYWQLKHCTAEALKACANVIQDQQNAARLVFWAIGFGNLREAISIRSGSDHLLTAGINMTTGIVAEALIILVNNFQENGSELPELLPPTMYRFAGNENPAIRALILRRLPYLQNRNPEFGWELFDLATQDSIGLWQYAERCLYYAYQDRCGKVSHLLERIRFEGNKKDMETWGRISALSALNNYVDFDSLLDDLNTLDITEAWQGAASVWTHVDNVRRYREQCLKGIKAGLKAGSLHAVPVAQKTASIFRESTLPISVPLDLIQLYFSVCENSSTYWFGEWLNVISQRSSELALSATGIYLNYIKHTKRGYYDYKNQLAQLLTRLFAEAEEREESDQGAMLNRVVAVQDSLLSLGVSSINDWLKVAER